LPLDDDMLDILVCPKCKGDLDYDGQKSRLVCGVCRLAYPVVDGIPVMLVDEAERVD
jgi:uncharacterized protein YbaR (Trm112 family)